MTNILANDNCKIKSITNNEYKAFEAMNNTDKLQYTCEFCMWFGV